MNGLRQSSKVARLKWLIPPLLFILALLPRLFDLDHFLTSDEHTNLYFAGSAVLQAMLNGDWRGTYWHFYPGVTMSWLDSLGLVGQWLIAQWQGTTELSLYTFVDQPILDLIVAVRLPYALLTALFVPCVYILLRQILDPTCQNPIIQWLCVCAALLIAFDPFFLAHSRVIHGDAPVSVFMGLSLLAFYLYLRQGIFRHLIFSAIMGSLAALTKAPGQLMAVLIIVLAWGDWLSGILVNKRPHTLDHWRWDHLKRPIRIILAWALLALLVFIVLWPAMWVDPYGTLYQMLDETFGKVNEGHLVYFMGQLTLDPGLWFYPYVIPFRLTPLTSIGLVLSLVVGFGGARSNNAHLRSFTLWLWGIVLFLLLFGMLTGKKQDRYLLPLFPMLDLLAASGWFGFIVMMQGLIANRRWTMDNDRQPFTVNRLWPTLCILLLLTQASLALPSHPYYLAYFNPLMGGLSKAVETTLVGWGEGMEKVAAYLNQKPQTEGLYVAAVPSQTLLPYFQGQGENFYTNDIAFRADYVVIYQAQKQRLAPSPEIVQHYLSQDPEMVINLHGVPYAWIYANTPLITADVPAWATLTNIGFGSVGSEAILRLAGYRVQQQGCRNDGHCGDDRNRGINHSCTLSVDLFWHALPAIERARGPCFEEKVENFIATRCPRLNYAVSVRLLNETDALIAQHDSWPAGGLLPTSLWRVNDYIRDQHSLTWLDELGGNNGSEGGDYRLAVVVYEAEGGEVLAGPVVVDQVHIK